MSEFIVENASDGTVTIDGVITILGHVADPEISRCYKCSGGTIYYDKFDAYFCAYCNLWLEKRCGDASCGYCASRPDRPLPAEHERKRLRD